MNKNKIIGIVVVLAVLAAVFYFGRDKMHFDFGVFASQLRTANWTLIAIAFACILLGYVFRSVRWALLLRHHKQVPVLSLLGTQVIGFTAVALIGRVADPVRPYLVAKKTGLPITNQVAVYIVERLFDLGAMALLFSSVILLAPADSLTHPEVFRKVGFGGLVTTFCAAIFLVALRLQGERVASFFESALGLFSKKLGHNVADKMRSFHAGLDTLRSLSDFAIALSLSLVMWGLITVTYLLGTRAFVPADQQATISLAKCMVLMGASGGASALQLPIVGWFTQIAAVMVTLKALFDMSNEAATACAAMLLIITFLGIIPFGLIWAQFEKISFSKITSESGQASEGAELLKEEFVE